MRSPGGVAEVAATEAEEEAAGGVADGEADVLHQQRVELAGGLVLVLALGQFHFLEHVRMATDRALAEDHQVAREDVRAFHRDEDRRALPGTTQVVVRAHDDALAAMDVHGMGDALAAALGEVVLEDRRKHRGLLAEVHRVGGEDSRAVHQPGVAADAGERLLDAFEGGDRHVELLADLGVATADVAAGLAGAGAHRRQRDGASDRQAVHQHHPAFADHFLPADDVLQRHEHVLAGVRTVHEGGAQRHVAAADLDPGGVGGDQRQGDAQVLLVAQQMVRVVALEGQAEEGGHRAEGDVALFPGQAQAEHLATFPFALADDADVGHAAGIGARVGAGEGEAGDVVALGQARQVALALLVGAVVEQQLGRAEGVRHHHRRGQVAATGGELHHYLRVGEGGEALAAVLLGNDQAEEAVLLDEGPGFFRQVHALADVPVADHGAEFFGRAVDEGLLFFGELRLGVVEQFLPVRAAAEQFAIPPHGARLDGLALGVGHRRQDFLEPGEQRTAEHAPAQVRQGEGKRHRQPEQPEDQQQPAGRVAEHAHQDQVGGADAERGSGWGTPMGEVSDTEYQYD